METNFDDELKFREIGPYLNKDVCMELGKFSPNSIDMSC